MFRKLRTVIYKTNDLAAAKSWYIKATGVDPYFDEPFYVGFDIHGFELGLDPDMKDVVPGNQTISYWDVEDVSKAAAHLTSIGAKLVQDKTNVGGPIFVAIVEDPFGNHLGLIQGA
ncbi:MAG: glyoxalase/bleomycin resistance/extradiol dioxygenase family protein [Citrobacter freundii]|nr:MAG: glyoxalase/bleomycin resistance/extradiol dioxygenase family protein [Citrobacter freundii]